MKSDEKVSAEMAEILRLKRIAEDTQKMFDAQRNADTPVPVAVDGGVTVELSPRDVGEALRIVEMLSRSLSISDFLVAKNAAKQFIKEHQPIGR